MAKLLIIVWVNNSNNKYHCNKGWSPIDRSGHLDEHRGEMVA